MTIPEGLIRLYSGSAVETSITADIIETTTSIPLQSTSGYPSPAANQYVAVRLGEAGPDEEIIYYGTKNGNTLQNCLRGQDGTVARTHKTGEKATHTSTALDFREANVHANTIDPAFVPHAHQLVHQSVAQTVSAAHTYTGNATHTGTEAFTDVDIVSADITTLRPTTIAGPVNVTGAVTYATPAAAPNKITGTTPLAGSSSTPMRSDATLAVDARAIVRIMYPAGSILGWASNTLPTEEGHAGEWLFPDGSEQLIATYPVLAARCGTTFGTASSGKFRMPNFNGRVLTGVDTAHGLGQVAGNTFHNLTVGEMPSHGHSVNDPQHSHNPPNGYDYVISSPNGEQHWITGLAQAAGGAGNTQVTFTRNVFDNTDITLQNTGGGQAFNIEQPWIGTRFIMKAH